MTIQDFVNREQQLTDIWDAIDQRSGPSLLMITGASGTGKSYLLEECRQRCSRAQIPTCKVDFMQPWSHDFLSVVHSVRRQLGPVGFDRLEQTLAEIRALSAAVPAQQVAPNAALPNVPGSRSTEPFAARSSAIDMSGTITARDIVGRDVNYVTQFFQYDGTFVAADIRERISTSLVDCLQAVAAHSPLVWLVDGWEKGVTDVHEWFSRYLLSALFDGALGKTVMIIAGQTLPNVPRIAGQVQVVTLAGLPEEALSEYWIQRRGLAEADFAAVMHLTRGHPAAVATLADLQSMTPTA